MKLLLKLIFPFLILLLAFCDKGTDNDGGGSLKAKDLRVTNEVSGWTEQQNSYVEFTPSNMYELIDGGVTPYIDGGLVEGIRQILKKINGTDTIQLIIDAEDFSNATNAQNIFNTITGSYISDSITFPEYSPTIAVGNYNAIGGEIVIFAHFDKFYFELKFTNFGSLKDIVIAESKKFLTAFESKINSDKY